MKLRARDAIRLWSLTIKKKLIITEPIINLNYNQTEKEWKKIKEEIDVKIERMENIVETDEEKEYLEQGKGAISISRRNQQFFRKAK